MPKTAGEFLVITDIPRHSVANALQVQARTDYGDAIRAVRFAFKSACLKVSQPSEPTMQEFRDAVASAHLEVNAACDAFVDNIAAAERLFQAGIDLQQDEEPEPPKEEIPQNV